MRMVMVAVVIVMVRRKQCSSYVGPVRSAYRELECLLTRVVNLDVDVTGMDLSISSGLLR